MEIDTSKWSGEGTFTQRLIDWLAKLDTLTLVRIEDAPASRSEADYNFISNEVCGVRDGGSVESGGWVVSRVRRSPIEALISPVWRLDTAAPK